MATDSAAESLPDWFSDHPRVDVVANTLRMSVDVFLGHLRHQGIYLNPGDRVPWQVAFDAMQAELDEGRGWQLEQLSPV